MESCVLNGLFFLLAVGNILRDPDGAILQSAFVKGSDREAAPETAAVPAAADLIAVVNTAVRHNGFDRRKPRAATFRRAQRGNRHPGQAARRIAEHRFQLGICANDIAASDNRDADSGRIENRVLFGEGLPKQDFRTLDLADIYRSAARTGELAFAIMQSDGVDP